MREVFAVHWNLVSKDTFCSSSWDTTVRVVHLPFPPLFPIYHPPPIPTILTKPVFPRIVEPHALNLPRHPPDPLLHILRLLHPALALPPLHRIQRLPPPALRPPHPRLRLQPPRPHHPHPRRPNAHAAPPQPGTSVPAQRSADARLEQIPVVDRRNGGRGPLDPDVRHPGAGTGTPGSTTGARLCRQEADVEPASLGYFAERELRHDLSDLDRRDRQGGATYSRVGRSRWRAR